MVVLRWRFSLSLLVPGLGLLVVSCYGLDRVLDRLALALSGVDTSELVRLEIWKTALAVIDLSPWLGSGFAGMRGLSPMFDTGYMPGFAAFDAHNDYLDLAIAVGIPCAVLILAALCFLLRRCLRGLLSPAAAKSPMQPLALGCLVDLLTAAGHECFDSIERRSLVGHGPRTGRGQSMAGRARHGNSPAMRRP